MARALHRRKLSRGIENARWLERNLGSNEIADHYKRGDVDAVEVVNRAAGFCGKAVFCDYYEDRLRPLRDRGLIQTDGDQSLRKSRYVRITELVRLVVEESPVSR